MIKDKLTDAAEGGARMMLAMTGSLSRVALSGARCASLGGASAGTGRNLRTGETVMIAATTRTEFSAGSTLNAALNPSEK